MKIKKIVLLITKSNKNIDKNIKKFLHFIEKYLKKTKRIEKY